MTLPDPPAFDAVVYDLDGALVDPHVDWNNAANDVVTVLRNADVGADSLDLWKMLDAANNTGVRDDLERELAAREREGTWLSDHLPPADHLADDDVPSGVCLLNAGDACQVTLDVHDLSGRVDAVVDRDSVATRKPGPEPLPTTLERMVVDPDSVVFVGDSTRDEVTADRAGVTFRCADGGPAGV